MDYNGLSWTIIEGVTTGMDEWHGWLARMTGMDDWHGWLAWMTGMDDWHGWLAWMTGVDDWHGWLLDWILYIDDKLTDGRTLLVVKSLSRLKIRFGEQFLHHGIFNNNIQHIIRKQIFTKIVNKVCPNKNDSVKSCQILLRHFFVHIIIHVFHRLNFLDPQPLSPSGARKCFHFSNCLWCCDGPVLIRMVACQRLVHQH